MISQCLTVSTGSVNVKVATSDIKTREDKSQTEPRRDVCLAAPFERSDRWLAGDCVESYFRTDKISLEFDYVPISCLRNRGCNCKS